MKKVLVLGLSPSPKGGNSPSLKRLNMWMNLIGVHYFSFANVYPDGKNVLTAEQIKEMSTDDTIIIALGQAVDNIMYHYRVKYPWFKVRYVKIDHPSPLNRNLNSSKYVFDMLQHASLAIRG